MRLPFVACESKLSTALYSKEPQARKQDGCSHSILLNYSLSVSLVKSSFQGRRVSTYTLRFCQPRYGRDLWSTRVQKRDGLLVCRASAG